MGDPEAAFVLRPWKDPAAFRALEAYREQSIGTIKALRRRPDPNPRQRLPGRPHRRQAPLQECGPMLQPMVREAALCVREVGTELTKVAAESKTPGTSPDFTWTR